MINQLALVNIKKDRDGLNELKNRVLFVILSIVLFRIGSFIPIPGINTVLLSQVLENHNGTIIEMFNMFSGGALSRASIFSLGIMPYISASIIIQLLTLIYSPLSELKKEGELGRKKINQYIRYTTLFLAIIQSIGIATSLPNMPIISSLVINPDIYFFVTAIISLVAGTMFLMWLGELITERGIGNGISVIIFIGIIAGLPGAIGTTIEEFRKGNLHFLLFLFIVIFIFLILFFVVYIERSQRKIIVHYARRQQGRRMYIAQSTHLPLKLNMSGVIPAIFASSVMFFPMTIITWFGNGTIKNSWINTMVMYLQPTQPIYMIIYSIFIIFFCFFYTGLIFSPRETADNLKKSGAFISGIRPGLQTAQYINRIMLRLTCLGSIYITFICLIPEFMRHTIKVPFYFGGTSLLIVVVVIIDFITQIQTLIMSNQYESMLKKSNLNL